jgi:hypothetical protein
MTVGLWIFPRAVTCLECGHLHVAGEITHMVTRPSDHPLPCAVCNACHTPAHHWLVHEAEWPIDCICGNGGRDRQHHTEACLAWHDRRAKGRT